MPQFFATKYYQSLQDRYVPINSPFVYTGRRLSQAVGVGLTAQMAWMARGSRWHVRQNVLRTARGAYRRPARRQTHPAVCAAAAGTK